MVIDMPEKHKQKLITSLNFCNHLTKYGNRRLQYLEENCPDIYMEYYQCGELYQHCLEVQNIAETRLRSMMKQFVANNPPPNRNTDGLAWAAQFTP